MRLEVREQKIAVRAQPEEPVALLHPLEHARGMEHAAAVDDLVVLLERLAAHAVIALVRLLIEVVRAALEDAHDERRDAQLVLGGRGAHELVVRDAEPPPHRLESFRNLIDERLRRNSAIRSGLRDLLAVLVHADQEPHLLAEKTMVAGDDVRADLLERMA